MSNLPKTVTFDDIEIELVDLSGIPWVTRPDLARALYVGKAGGHSGPSLENAVKSLDRLYERNAAEFSPDMTCLLKLPTKGGMQDTRIFRAPNKTGFGLLGGAWLHLSSPTPCGR